MAYGLCQEIFQISTFMDEEQVRGGENLKHQLTRAIRNLGPS